MFKLFEAKAKKEAKEKSNPNQKEGAVVNELHFLKALRRHLPDDHPLNGKLSDEEQKEHDRNAKIIGPEKTGIQQRRAEAQVEAFLEDARQRGYSGLKHAHHSAKAGDILKVTGHDQSQKENPSDVLTEWEKGPTKHYGASLKSTKNKEIGFHNGGAGSTLQAAGLDLTDMIESEHTKFAKKHNLPLVATKRKDIIDEDPQLKSIAREEASKLHSKVADTIQQHLSNMPHEKLRDYLTSVFLKDKDNPVPYTKVTGRGGEGNRAASAHTSYYNDNPVSNSLRNSSNIRLVRTGDSYLHVIANNRHMFNIQVKHNSTGMATSMKILGQPSSEEAKNRPYDASLEETHGPHMAYPGAPTIKNDETPAPGKTKLPHPVKGVEKVPQEDSPMETQPNPGLNPKATHGGMNWLTPQESALKKSLV